MPPARVLYEPKWDGFRCIVFRDGDEVEIGSRNERPLTRYFPEVVDAVQRSFPARASIDGEIVIAGDDGLDFDALQQRIHPAASRVNLLAEQTPASFVAFDLLALGDDDLRERRSPSAGRARTSAGPCRTAGAPDARSRAISTSPTTGSSASRAPASTALIAKRADLTYQPDKRVMTKIKHVRTADCVVAGYRSHKAAADAIGSLLLGLYIDEAAPPRTGAITTRGSRRWA